MRAAAILAAVSDGSLAKAGCSFSYAYDRRRYGIPVAADEIDLEYLRMRRPQL